MGHRFLVTTAIPDPGFQLLSDAGEVTVLPEPPDYETLAAFCASGDFDAVLTQLRDVVDAPLLAGARVKGISNYAVGYNNIDIDAATRHGILVGNTPGVLTDATADIAMLLILGAARRVVEADRLVRDGKFHGWEPELLLGRDVSGAVLGVAGFGRIARATARRALGFGMQVIFSPRPPGDRPVSEDELGEFAGKVQQVAWSELIERSDFLSLHVPLNEDTRHLVDAQILGRMKPDAILINTARGPVVDEAALVDALRSGVIAGAGLDVFEDEPKLAAGLAELPNTVLLPHVGSATVRVRSEMARLSALNAIAIAEGRLPLHPVNPQALA
ncbi:D-isomer specific 2-hydroxyacid dehydrogenase NAD-binding [Pseudarthrobacter chlorophenolicus A6]|uniref:D-isomer specific 2-hydroxyacid dehydrogenase NAD-binding n=1 Tax=Pseudarthrobacter chlorophenolicus (strain ATCC 700700 / DSM 12829 / CIP 107037 / JCM 12360 / KCTC 9906 / NCIMB 13794 / A6) TaxID=452863 RepID=B8H936_PSECP|nr:D-glycerate dehydrogenase [Pseudarthrobacter chlorophenolicus]ACL38195.1 D-isomer specific 2-hydroxyacid dehydrogenase NAD-binding [Pseudarthrobacter chlorophenolicus A6]SDQ53606.1 glyoxylate reductase [Pseudarthrobacter chlorophenolicus]